MPRLDPQLAESLANGTLVLTANQRAARTLRKAYGPQVQAVRANTSPNVFALDAWLTSAWHRLLLAGLSDRVLLNRSQEQAIWRGIIQQENPDAAAESLAAMAAEAWARLLLHGGRQRLREAGVSPDTRAFQRWAQAFERRSTRERWLTTAQLPAELAAAAQDLDIPAAGILLIGFDVIPPALASFFETIQRAGFPVIQPAPTPPAAERHRIACADETAELRAAARFVQQVLDENPDSRIALIVPQLAERRHALARTLREVFSGQGATLFEFSLGYPLAETPLAASALDLLRWTQAAAPLETVSALLVSPFFGGSLGVAERTAAAEFDAFVLRKMPLLRPELTILQLTETLEQVIETLEDKAGQPLADLLSRLRAIDAIADAQADGPATHTVWAEHFRAILEASRIARRAGDNSAVFQAQARWESALDELATLDFDGATVTAKAALESLERIATETIFAPESQDTPIQIMGPLEAAGSHFDALWVLGAGEMTWPPQSATTPLLPWHLQHELAMPGADPAHERLIAQRLTERLAGAADTVVFSYAAVFDDAHQHASPLLASLELSEAEPATEPSRTPLTLDLVADDLALPPLPDQAFRGGAQILALQAACPFRAFAEQRLASTSLEQRSPGQDARERGQNVHAVMQKFWADVEHQDKLRELTTEQRDTKLDESIEAALAKAQRQAASHWDIAYLTVQRERLRQLLRPWLDLEAMRPAFAVRQQEQAREAQLGPLRLNLRYDRIDQTAVGDLILDYKTGPAAPTEWLSERPDAPQLPLYAVLHQAEQPDEPLAGIAFALLRAGNDLSLEGYASSEEALLRPKNKEFPFDHHLAEWQRVLTNLATDFANGEAAVDPKRYPATCEYCTQRILCRLNPEALAEEEEAEPVAS